MTCNKAFSIKGKDRSANIIILCDHASNRIPPEINNGCLGLSKRDMERHIAYDVGAAGVSQHLGALLDAPVITSNFSRLVIDPNRGEDDPTLLMRLYDGSIIPANRYADEAEKNRRLELCYRPYDQAITDTIAQYENPILISMHSFTPQLNGRAKRPWEIGVLFAQDQRLSAPFITSLQRDPELTIGINEPYSGKLDGDTMDRHAMRAGHLHALIEVRNDLIETENGQKQWAERLAPHLITAIEHATNQGA
ncbi:N-formylglutamate amidohydrolase [Amylibacter kogurei]|uniref:N-formylglutamate amidohydrolase n=1 Tax=Paramylibacter kogurei TaxID=1889778 RepID=A0A2G5K196_9RHOB|nr:N-formylglutamate amidohydrolase [Amylibacter kogurei]PIB23205.1 N-formylglutamate amidohydrolase [Amylibacter kogurei]